MLNSDDHYSVLQVSPKASQADIKTAFRRLVRQYHPDLNPNDAEAAAAFRKICTAYETLSNKNERILYDHHYRRDSHYRPNHYQPPQQPSPSPSPSAFVEEPSSVVLQDAQQYFMQGVQKANQRNYAGAIAAFTQAIDLDQSYLEAYMGRCQAHFALGHSRQVLTDCDHILQRQPNSAQAFLFRGRACQRLGHLDLSTTAYSQAITLDPHYAQAYYHRGLAQVDSKPRQAIQDLQAAAGLFRQQGQTGNYRRATTALGDLNRRPLQLLLSLPNNLISILGMALTTAPSLLINPGNGPFLTWQKILPSQSIGISFVFAGLALGCAIGNSHQRATGFSLNLSVLQLILLSCVAFSSLVITGGLLRRMMGQGGGWSGDFLIAGATLLPMGIWTILAGPVAATFGRLEFIALSLFTGSYTLLTLYGGYTKIGQLSEQLAALAAPVALLVTYGFTMLLYKALTLQLV